MIDLEELKTCIRNDGIEKVFRGLDWKEFEQAVSEIFAENSFKTFHSFRFKTKGRHEIDIVAVRNGLVVCVDCKKWERGRYKSSGLRQAADEQKERTNEFRLFLKGNIIAQSRMDIGKSQSIYPLVVTLFEEEIVQHDGCFVVPVWKLNSFLVDIEKNIGNEIEVGEELDYS